MHDIYSIGTSNKFLGGLRELEQKLTKWVVINRCKYVRMLLTCSRYDEYKRKNIIKTY